jgi:hypothetical protein
VSAKIDSFLGAVFHPVFALLRDVPPTALTRLFAPF